MQTIHDPRRNHLLAALPSADYERLLPHLMLVPMTLGEALYESGILLRHVYFPTDSFISLVTPMEGHGSLEVGMVGDEGMLGISLILGVNISPLRCLVQGAGSALRMSTATFHRQLAGSKAL